MKQFIFLLTLASLLGCQKEDFDAPGALVPRTVDQDASLPSAIIHGTMLHTEAFGSPSDPMVVLIHGGPGGDYRSLLQAQAFAQDGYYVVFYDQRGTGLSKREDAANFSEDGVQLMIDDLTGIIQHYQQSDSQKVFLIGHSWGAMLAAAYLNQYPEKIAGAVLAEPGGLTWPQVEEYLSRSNHVRIFTESLNDAVFTEQIFSGGDSHERLDYKGLYFGTFENAPGNTIGNAGPYPYWRSGTVAFNTLYDFAVENGIDFTSRLSRYQTKVLFIYSELNTAYGLQWAETVSEPFPVVEIREVKGSGHELLYFGWNNFYPQALTYLNDLR